MKSKYFQDTDMLYIEFRPAEVAETRDLDENTLLDIDREGTSVASRSNMQVTVLAFPPSLSSKYLHNKLMNSPPLHPLTRAAAVP